MVAGDIHLRFYLPTVRTTPPCSTFHVLADSTVPLGVKITDVTYCYDLPLTGRWWCPPDQNTGVTYLARGRPRYRCDCRSTFRGARHW